MSTRAHRGFASRSTLLVIAAAFAAGLGLSLAQRWFPSNADRVAMPATPALKTVRLIEPPRAMPPFALPLADGRTAMPATLAGHWTIVFLGFTHCPDVCPTTLQELSRAQAAWRKLPEATRPRLLFVSVDPDRDTPQVAGQYASYFSPDTLAAAPRAAELARFARDLGLVYMKVPTTGADYSVDHSATLVLLDPQGRQAGLIRPPLVADDIAADLAALAAARP